MENIDNIENIDKLTELILQGENEKEAKKFRNLQEILINQVDINNIKQIRTDATGNVYTLFKDGTFYINKNLEDQDIKEIYAFDINHVYKITTDNKILSVTRYCDDIDNYICNNEIPYKKIILLSMFMVALTDNKKVISISNMPRFLCDSR